jgi:tetratricopeptide (TPR) repeat protein
MFLINGEYERARDLAESAAIAHERLRMRFRLADTLGLLAAIYIRLGDIENARARLRRAAQVFQEMGDVSWLAGIYEFGARLAAEEKNYALGAGLLGAVQKMRDQGSPFLLPSEVIGLLDPEAEIRGALTPEDFDAAFMLGRSWTREEALAQATQ